MVNDLTNSQHDRQNILNNRYALEKVEEHLGLGGMTCKKKLVLAMENIAVSVAPERSYRE